MRYLDIQNLRELVGRYLYVYGQMLKHYGNHSRADVQESTREIHEFINGFNLDDVPAMLDMIDPHTDVDILDHEGLPSVIDVLQCLCRLLDEYSFDIVDYDKDFATLHKFAENAIELFKSEKKRMEHRYWHEPSPDDIESADIIRKRLRGILGHKSWGDVINTHVLRGLSGDYAIRRIEYLMKEFQGHDDVVRALKCAMDKVEREKAQQRIPTSTQIELTQEPQPSPSVQPTAKAATKIDADRLGRFFNAKFKGVGSNYNYFDDMTTDIQTIKIPKELAMIAVMIYDCSQYFIQRPSTFASWLREFFEIIGRKCPKDKRKSKYKPTERVKRMFYYLE